jgi:hypothetical protein
MTTVPLKSKAGISLVILIAYNDRYTHIRRSWDLASLDPDGMAFFREMIKNIICDPKAPQWYIFSLNSVPL